MICPNCGTELKEGASFCTECGTRLTIPQTSPNTVPPIIQPTIEAAPAAPGNVAINSAAPGKAAVHPAAVKKPVKKSSIIIAVIAVLAAIAGIVLALVLTSGSAKVNGKEYALYIKDGELWYTVFSKTGPWQITDQLFAGDLGYKDISGDKIADKCFVSKDYSMIYYPDHIEDDFDTITLYARSLTKKDKEPVRIAKDILSYIPSEDNSNVLYQDSNGDLFLFSLKQETKEKIAKDLLYNNYAATKDLKTIAYLEEGTLYLLRQGEEKVKMAGDVLRFGLSEDGSYVIYTTNETGDISVSLYKKTVDGNKTKIADEAILRTELWAPIHVEGFYYNVIEQEMIKAIELFEDDVPSDTSYDSFRETVEESEFKVTKTTYYYYDGTQSVKLVESYTYNMEMDFIHSMDDEGPVPIYSLRYYEKPEGLIKFSDEKPDSLRTALARLVRPFKDVYLIGGYLFDTEAMRSTFGEPFFDEGELYYYKKPDDFEGEGEPDEADLYRLDLTTGEETLVFAGIEDGVKVKGNDLYHMKDVKKEIGSLYINDQWIADDVGTETFYELQLSAANQKRGAFFYFATDYERDVSSNTGGNMSSWSLWVYDGQKATHIGDEVHDMMAVGGEGILYITDFSSKRRNGDMYLYVNGKSELVDEEVSYIFRTR